MKNNLFDTLKEVLKKDDRFISNEGDLLKNIIRENAINLDKDLIGLLLDDDILKNKFFIKIKDSLVFDSKNFINFLNNKEFLENSFTRFKNKVGLTDKQGDFLASSNEIVLSWPYKDCILAGGQDKEDTKRDEIFYNEILGSDDIDRLLDEKVFTNFKRIDKDGEHKLKEFKRDKEINKKRGLSEDTITDNLLIKGNNLLALHSLKSNFAGKVKLIYIDPPYNTGNDSFKYNDRFNHSTWLTFMKNRLEVAKELLKDDGVIFVQCDDNEQAYLKVLMDGIFGRDKFIGMFMWMKTSTPPSLSKNIRKKLEYILCFTKNEIGSLNGGVVNGGDMPLLNNGNKNGILNFPIGKVEFKLKGGLYKGIKDRVELVKELEIEKKYNKNNLIIKGPFKWTQDKLDEDLKNGTKFIIKSDKFAIRYERLGDRIKVPSNLISKKECEVGTNEDAKKELDILFEKNNFSFPKPETLLNYLIKSNTNINDIVLDYHLGSGTTSAVAHKMNRQYIGIEQMDYIETISKERLKKVIEGEQGGISKSVEWKGGGDFVYMEIMEENERIIKEIEEAKNDDEIIKIYDNLKDSEFINFYVDIEKIDENLKDENNKDGISFENLSLENKKRFLIELLDKNLLYKNYSEMKDGNSGVEESDKKMNDEFYKS